MFDTGINKQESIATLLHQQQRLLAGIRSVQMFPTGTAELPLPLAMARTTTLRGVFHYNPQKITETEVITRSYEGRENEYLELGPYSKVDIQKRLDKGEKFTTVSENTPDGTEVRTAVGTNKTLPEQLEYFEKTKQAGNTIYHGALPQRTWG